MTKEQQEKEVKELADLIKKDGAYSAELDAYAVNPTTAACRILNNGYRKAGDTISQDSIKAMKKAEAIQFGRIIPIDHDREG